MTASRPAWLLSHPHGNHNAAGTAAGLERAGALARYVTGLSASHGSLRGTLLEAAAQRWPTALNRVVQGVAPRRLMSLGPVEALARVSARAGFWGGYDAMFLAHDAAVSLVPWPRGTGGVYAYEDAARWTFQRARRLGLAAVYDLPLPHWRTIAALWAREAAAWPDASGVPANVEPPWKTARKDRELELCHHVCVASAFTRESLERAGVDRPVTVVPYGFPVTSFQPRTRPPEGPFTVLSVGTADLRKGSHILLAAWSRAGLKDARLRHVGAMRLSPTFVSAHAPSLEHVPSLPRDRLADEFRAADVLAFPTLGDGFGLVMQEAMCCGLPVITTRCGGGPECITPGEDGWLVPERDVDALVETLRSVAANRDHTHAVGQAARRRAERWTWGEAGAALARSAGEWLRAYMTM